MLPLGKCLNLRKYPQASGMAEEHRRGMFVLHPISFSTLRDGFWNKFAVNKVKQRKGSLYSCASSIWWSGTLSLFFSISEVSSWGCVKLSPFRFAVSISVGPTTAGFESFVRGGPAHGGFCVEFEGFSVPFFCAISPLLAAANSLALKNEGKERNPRVVSEYLMLRLEK